MGYCWRDLVDSGDRIRFPFNLSFAECVRPNELDIGAGLCARIPRGPRSGGHTFRSLFRFAEFSVSNWVQTLSTQIPADCSCGLVRVLYLLSL